VETARKEVTNIGGTGEPIMTTTVIGCEDTAFRGIAGIDSTSNTVVAVEVFREVDASDTVLTGIQSAGDIVIAVEPQRHGSTTHSGDAAVLGASLAIITIGVIGHVLTIIIHMTDIIGTWISIRTDVICRRKHAIIGQTTGVFCAVHAIFAQGVFREEETARIIAGVYGAEKTIITGEVSCFIDTALGFCTGVCGTAFSVITGCVIQSVDTSSEEVTEVIGTVDSVYTQEVICEFRTALNRVTNII
jgi:hypothetical protein